MVMRAAVFLSGTSARQRARRFTPPSLASPTARPTLLKKDPLLRVTRTLSRSLVHPPFTKFLPFAEIQKKGVAIYGTQLCWVGKHINIS